MKKKNTDPWQQTTVPPLRVILVLLSSSHLSNAIKDGTLASKYPPECTERKTFCSLFLDFFTTTTSTKN